MADLNVKISLIRMKITTRKFSKSLIMNCHPKFENSKLRIQYGELENKNLFDWNEN